MDWPLSSVLRDNCLRLIRSTQSFNPSNIFGSINILFHRVCPSLFAILPPALLNLLCAFVSAFIMDKEIQRHRAEDLFRDNYIVLGISVPKIKSTRICQDFHWTAVLLLFILVVLMLPVVQFRIDIICYRG